MSDFLLLTGTLGAMSAMEVGGENVMPDDFGTTPGGFSLFGIGLPTLLLFAGIYFAFIKGGKKKKMGYALLIGWAFFSGMIPGVLGQQA